MGWFDEQIKQRNKSDNLALEKAFSSMSQALGGETIDSERTDNNALNSLKSYFHIDLEIPDEIEGVNERLEYLIRPYGIMRRTVNLTKDWYKDATGVMLAYRKEDNALMPLFPNLLGGYHYVDPVTGKKVRVNKKNQDIFMSRADLFYKPFPLRKLSIKDLGLFMLESLSKTDWCFVLLSSFGVMLIGLLIARLNLLLFGKVIDSGSNRVLMGGGIFLVTASLAQIVVSQIQSLVNVRLSTKVDLAVESASMMRLLSLPPSFFRQWGSGETSTRLQYIKTLCSTLSSLVLSVGINGFFSIGYLGQIFSFTPSMVIPALLIILVTVAFSTFQMLIQVKVSSRQMQIQAKENALSYSLISGIQKIRLTGAEKRAFSRWGIQYSQQARLSYNPPVLLRISNVISTAITLGGTIILYYVALSNHITVANYKAFLFAFGAASGSFQTLTSLALSVSRIRPILDMVKPFLDTEPETSIGKHYITKLRGEIEVNNLSFRYSETMPLILDSLNLKINPGDYLAIVGETGCGKSTLVRILLGFETPQKGGVFYDKKELTSLDVRSLRSHIGVVMQNGKLFNGSIFENIVLAAPWLTLNDAWEAAELAGIADDIRAMPMGMQTMISEGTGGISGGQKQRLMIARALAPKPKILIFDEATSALDNITQKKISDALNRLSCTRIVIAHRLSTISACNRIIYLKNGHIQEDGTYQELLELNGLFAQLVERQRIQ